MSEAAELEQPARAPGTTAASLWLVMMKAYRSVQNYIESTMEQMGLGLSDFMILEALLHKGPMSMSQLGDKVLLANPSMTAAVDRLTKLGFVTRQCPSEDRRVRNVELTREGRRVIRKVFAQHEQDLEGLMEGLCEEQRARLRAMLKDIGLAAKAKTENG
jgi:MarR family transcriptional regulator, 2-MHQ and catechol-resistance regulon repressor